MTVAIDASAILAVILNEDGATSVLPYLESGVVSSVNHAEVLARMSMLGVPTDVGRSIMEHLRVEIVDFTVSQAERVADLRGPTAPVGLSLGDRACLALAADRSIPAVTADRSWVTVDTGVEVRVIR